MAFSSTISFDACSTEEPGNRIPAITVKQPFASLIVWGAKTIETRSKPIRYRGPIIITSGKTVFEGPSFLIPGSKEYADLMSVNMPCGFAIGVVTLIDCRPMEPADEEFALVPYSEGLYSWVLSNPVQIENFETPGRLGVFYLPKNKIVTKYI